MSRNRTSKPSRNEIYKIRYNLYREAGYSPSEARRLRGRALDIGNLRLNRDGSVPKDSEVFQDISKNLNVGKSANEHKEYLYTLPFHETLYEVKDGKSWGMYTHDDRYKDDTMRIVKQIQNNLNISNDQAFYFFYIMVQYNKTYDEVKRELLSSKEFEMYDANKMARNRSKYERYQKSYQRKRRGKK